MTREQIKAKFPNASESFVRMNSETIDPAKLYERYCFHRNIHKAAKEFGSCGETARQLLVRAGYRLFNSNWTLAEKATLIEYYTSTPSADFRASELANRLGRTTDAIILMASELGVTNDPRDKRPLPKASLEAIAMAARKRMADPAEREKISVTTRAWLSSNPHPKGFSGHKHTAQTLALIGEKSSAWQQSMSASERRSRARMIQEKTLKNGNPLAPRIKRGSWHAEWVEIGGKKFFARSKWESDYARFLQWQKEQMLIADWDHEAKTFWFPIKRGRNNYTPDFSVTTKAGIVEYHEVKGWMDARSKSHLNRMRRYHSKEILRVIGHDWFKANRSFVTK